MELLLPMLQDGDATVRLTALQSLHTGDRRTIPAYRKMLNDSDKDVRDQAKGFLDTVANWDPLENSKEN